MNYFSKPVNHAYQINVEQAWECGYWCQRFGVTEIQLRTAVREVGALVLDVERHLVSRSI